jgi:hypothetical protein
VRRHFGGVGGARPSSFLVGSDIAGADDVLVPRDVESGDPGRWAGDTRKFSELFTISAR